MNDRGFLEGLMERMGGLPTITKEEVIGLSNVRTPLCVSVYMPTVKGGPEVRQNPVRLKNLLRKAEESLDALGVAAAETQQLLEPVSVLYSEGDARFWARLARGLAIFTCSEGVSVYKVPFEIKETMTTGSTCYLRPLLDLWSLPTEYCVLAISQKKARLVRFAHDEATDVASWDAAEFPALRFESGNDSGSLQGHTIGQGSRGSQQVVHHGHEERMEHPERRVLPFFREVDKKVRSLLHQSSAPLILAGADYLHPVYKEANSYSNLLEEGVAGNPEGWGPEELTDRARHVTERLSRETVEGAIAAYREVHGTERGSDDLTTSLLAALDGRVDTLLIARDFNAWGQTDKANRAIDIHRKRKPGDEELLNIAAVWTLQNGGVALSIDSATMPEHAEIAALLRY